MTTLFLGRNCIRHRAQNQCVSSCRRGRLARETCGPRRPPGSSLPAPTAASGTSCAGRILGRPLNFPIWTPTSRNLPCRALQAMVEETGSHFIRVEYTNLEAPSLSTSRDACGTIWETTLLIWICYSISHCTRFHGAVFSVWWPSVVLRFIHFTAILCLR